MKNWLRGAEVYFQKRPPESTRPCLAVGVLAPSNSSTVVITYKAEDSTGATSSAEVVLAASAEMLASWRASLGVGNPDHPFDGVDIIVADPQPDTCLALVVLARRLNGIDTADRWVKYVSSWERGFTGGPSVDAAFGPLHSAMTHLHYDDLGHGQADVSSKSVGAALVEGCVLLDELICAGADPLAMQAVVLTDPEAAALLARARSALAAEREEYLRVVRAADRVQLSIPMQGGGRRRTVDAILIVERKLTGALKAFLRSTPESPSGNGFHFNGVYRPDLKGKGYDITFSLEPSSGVWLRDLWLELEKLEWAKYDGDGLDRPQDSPRPDLVTYRSGIPGETIRKANEPWYDGAGAFTIIGAPRALKDGETGTKLSWSEALDAVWRLYSPACTLRLVSRDDWDEARGKPGSTLTELDLVSGRHRDKKCRNTFVAEWKSFSRANSEDSGKRLISLVLHPDQIEIPEMSETLLRCLASYISDGASAMDRLPPRSEFQVVTGRGGLVLISRHGVALVDLARSGAFPLEALEGAIRAAMRQQAAARQLERRLTRARESALKAALNNPRSSKSKALAEIYEILADGIEASELPGVPPEDPFLGTVENALEEAWRPGRRFDDLVRSATALREMVITASSERLNSTLFLISFVGFPFALLSNFFSWSTVPQAGRASPIAGLEFMGVQWGGVITWIVCGGLIAIILWSLANWFGRSGRRRRPVKSKR